MRKILYCTLLVTLLGFATGTEVKAQKTEAEMVAKAAELINEAELGKAKEMLEKALKNNSQSPEANYYLGYCYFAEGEYAKATPYLEIGTRSAGELGISAYEALGSNLLNNEEYDAVIKWMTEAIGKHGDNSTFYRALALAYAATNNQMEAENAFAKSLQYSSNPYFLLGDIANYYDGSDHKVKYVLTNMLVICRTIGGGYYKSLSEETYFWLLQSDLYLRKSKGDFTADETEFFADINMPSEEEQPEAVFRDALDRYTRLIAAANENQDKIEGATYARIMKIHREIKENGLTEAFIHFLMMTRLESSAEWINQHEEEVNKIDEIISAK